MSDVTAAASILENVRRAARTIAWRIGHPDLADDVEGEALASYYGMLADRPEQEPAVALRFAIRRARTAVGFGRTIETRNYRRDGMSADAAGIDQFAAPADVEPENVETIVAKLPDELQPTARLLSYGRSQRSIAAAQGLSVATVNRRCQAIREWIQRQRGE